jgi:nucleotide-binding universal stress UspA family protein
MTRRVARETASFRRICGQLPAARRLPFWVVKRRAAFMIALKKILVPHDFSDTSEAAVRYATALAHNFGAKLYLLHVSDKAKFEMATEFPLGLDGTLEDAVRERLVKILSPREQMEFKPAFEFRSGAPAMEIIRYAKAENIDLIVMGTHGRGFVAHVVLGSVAEKVVRTAPCPVLTVRNPEHEFIIPEDAAEQLVHAAH